MAGIIPLEYSQHRAKRHDVAMAVERGRVQVWRAASVKKQGIGATQPVTEQARKGVKRHLSLGDGKYDPAIRAYPHTIARFERRAVPVETRMQAAVYHQHRPGLRRQVRAGSLLEKCPRLRDGRHVGRYIEDAVRFHVKITIARSGVCTHELPPLFH